MQEDSIRRYCNIAGQYSDDLFQNVWVAILEIPESRLIEIHTKGYLKFYVWKIICKINSRQYKKKAEVISLDSCTIGFSEQDMLEARIELNKVQSILNDLHWYDKKLFELYLQEGSYRKVEKLTKIGYNSVQDTVLKVRKILKDGIK